MEQQRRSSNDYPSDDVIIQQFKEEQQKQYQEQEEQELLVSKIHVLLGNDNDNGFFQDEQNLVILVLLLRVNDDTDLQELLVLLDQKSIFLWLSNKLILSHTNLTTLTHDEYTTAAAATTTTTTTTMITASLFARLAAQLLFRITTIQYNNNIHYSTCNNKIQNDDNNNNNVIRIKVIRTNIMNILGETLIEYWKKTQLSQQDPNQNNNNNNNIALLEIIISFNTWFDYICNKDGGKEKAIYVIDETLLQLWIAISLSTQQQQQQQQKQQNNDYNNSNSKVNNNNNKDNYKNIDLNHQSLMNETLIQLLNQTTLIDKQQQTLQEELILLFLQYGNKISKVKIIPSYFQPMLLYWLKKGVGSKKEQTISNNNNKNYSNNIQQQQQYIIWAEILLQTIQYIVFNNNNTLSSLYNKQNSLLILQDDIIQLILSCLVTTISNDKIRIIAWMTVVVLLQQNDGFNFWLSSTNNNNNKIFKKLGIGQKLCTLIRLTSGEFHIQVSNFVNNHNKNNKEQEININSNNHQQQEEYKILRCCAQIIVMTVSTFLVKLTEQDDNDMTIILSGDAILHIRKSLDEALSTTAQYLIQRQENQQQQQQLLLLTDNQKILIDESIIRVFATILSEIDIYEQYNNNEDYVNSIINALSIALKLSMNNNNNNNNNGKKIELIESLLPCIASILASVEGFPLREKFIYDTLLSSNNDIIIIKVLQDVFVQTTSTDSIIWACQIFDLLYSSSYASSSSIIQINNELQRSMISFLQRILIQQEENGSSQNNTKMKNAVSTVLACFVTLQGDEPPNEPDSVVIQQVFEYCNH